MGCSFDWVGAFTDRAFGGNGCVVVHGADRLSLDDRMALVRETSLSECAFVVASDKADFGARYYLAEREILMAGHPTIATVASLLSRGLVALDKGRAAFTLEVGAGVLPIEVTQNGDGAPEITMTQPRPQFGARHDAGEVAALFGLAAGDVLGTPRTVSTGTPFCITLLKDKKALRRAVLDAERLAKYAAGQNGDFFEPFLVTLGGETPQGDVFSRLLLPPPMPEEDPFTGSATGCMAACLWAEGRLDSPRFVAEQGHWLGRPGRAQVTVLGPRDDISAVQVAGTGHVLMRGELFL